MKRWLVGMTAGWLILTGCGKEQQKSTPVSPQQQETATSVAATVEFVGPRNKPLPQVDPFAFEAPLTAGEFRRQSVEGHTTSMQTGGQLVTYKNEAGSVAADHILSRYDRRGPGYGAFCALVKLPD